MQTVSLRGLGKNPQNQRGKEGKISQRLQLNKRDFGQAPNCVATCKEGAPALCGCQVCSSWAPEARDCGQQNPPPRAGTPFPAHERQPRGSTQPGSASGTATALQQRPSPPMPKRTAGFVGLQTKLSRAPAAEDGERSDRRHDLKLKRQCWWQQERGKGGGGGRNAGNPSSPYLSH